MNKDFSYNFLGTFDTGGFEQLIKNLNEEDWNEYTVRQKKYEVHRHTLTIPLIFDNFTNIPKNYPKYEIFKDEILKLEDFFKQFYMTGKLIRCLLVKLLPESYIPKHVDRSYSLEISNRHHIPVTTHEDILFFIDDEPKNMKIGEVWEINNTKPHNVSNPTQYSRIHIIADWKNVRKK